MTKARTDSGRKAAARYILDRCLGPDRCFGIILAITVLAAPGAIIGAITGAGPASAQGLSTLQSNDGPLEINAEEGIEWQRDQQLYIARGNARASSGDLEVFGDVLTAHYNKAATGASEIDRIDIQGNVRIVSPSETVYGDNGVYDVVNGVLVLVGKNLRLVSKKDTLTARDSLEYWEHKQLAVARGNAEAIREDKRIKADVLSAHFEPNKQDKLEITRIDAFGNVKVATAHDFARGDRGVYFVNQELATLSGSVKITREDNQLNGEYAEINLATGVSRLLGAPPGAKPGTGGDTRVRGLILPRKKPSSDGGQ